MRLYKRGTIWWADFGRGRRQSTGTDDKAQAKRWAEHRAVQLWESEKLGIAHHTWREGMLAYLDESQHLRSLNDTKDRLRWLDAELGETPLRAITQQRIEQLIGKLQTTRAPATVNRYMAALGTVLRVAVRKGWLDAVPHIRKLKERNQRTRWITPEQAAALLKELPPHLNTMAAFALMTGLRASNIQNLQWGQVSIERRVAWVAADDFKSGKAHSVPLNDAAITVLRMDARPSMEVHELLGRHLGTRGMGARFELMACDWGFKGRCTKAQEREQRDQPRPAPRLGARRRAGARGGSVPARREDHWRTGTPAPRRRDQAIAVATAVFRTGRNRDA